MKLIAVLLFVIIFCSENPVLSQTIGDTLGWAYSKFDKKDYTQAAQYFDHFLLSIDGKKEDYYLAGVCYARLHDLLSGWLF